MSKMAIEHVIEVMQTDPLRAWSIKELAKVVPLPTSTFSSALNMSSKQVVGGVVDRVGHGKYKLRLEWLMPWVVDSDPVFVYNVAYAFGPVNNPGEGTMMIKARNAIEAGLKANVIIRREISDVHIVSIDQED